MNFKNFAFYCGIIAFVVSFFTYDISFAGPNEDEAGSHSSSSGVAGHFQDNENLLDKQPTQKNVKNVPSPNVDQPLVSRRPLSSSSHERCCYEGDWRDGVKSGAALASFGGGAAGTACLCAHGVTGCLGALPLLFGICACQIIASVDEC